MTYAEAITTLTDYIVAAKPSPAQRQAVDAIAAIADELDLIRRRYADKEAVRLGHIVRHALTPEQYYAAEQAARAEHPEAWAGRLPAVWAEKQGKVTA